MESATPSFALTGVVPAVCDAEAGERLRGNLTVSRARPRQAADRRQVTTGGGWGYETLTKDQVAQIVDAFPRLEMKHRFIRAVCSIVEPRPSTTYDSWMQASLAKALPWRRLDCSWRKTANNCRYAAPTKTIDIKALGRSRPTTIH